MLSQLESSGRGSHETGNADAYEVLSSHLTSVPMKDGDKWLSELMVKNKLLGYRISEVRNASLLRSPPKDSLPWISRCLFF